MKKISVDNFKGDPLFPKIQTAVAQLLEREKGIVTPVSVFVALGNLNPKEVEAWRRRQIPFLEKAVQGNLAKISRILRILRFHGHDLLLMSDKRHLLPDVALLRTERATFEALRSSLSKAF